MGPVKGKGEALPKVFVPNRCDKYDLSDAGRFGEVVYLTEGPVRRTAVEDHYAAVRRGLQGSSPQDYVVVGSLSVLTALAASVFAAKHKRLNLLLWEQGQYIRRCVSEIPA